ncbi:MAG TPA: hypothetical protein VK800_12855 [Steroidobacteraceae bacterium]|jgi:hypothetical protein|nr:hypothetical protein [Steroidobacteraceae bacterium]
MNGAKVSEPCDLVARAEAGDRHAADVLLRRFAAGDTSPAVLDYMRRCCQRIVRGEKPSSALHLVRIAGRPEAARRAELDRHFEICKALLDEVTTSPGRGKLGRARAVVEQRMELSPRAVRTAWQDRVARVAAMVSAELKREGLDLTPQDRNRLKRSKRAK